MGGPQMIETLLCGLFGGAFRLAPEILKWSTAKASAATNWRWGQGTGVREAAWRAANVGNGAGADAAWNVGAIETLREAVRTQGEKTGVRWADALSISVRPVITYWFMVAVLRRQDGGILQQP